VGADSFDYLAFERLERWLDYCDECHPCYPKTPPPLPTRLLEIDQQNYSVRLRETAGQFGRYIALSHSWGTSHRLTTIKANYEAQNRGISFGDLPPTFLDVIKLAFRLGISFIWIDSLCIIQDDPSDWEAEASKMNEVYSNSYLTVSASSSRDDSSGCFPNKDKRYDSNLVSIDSQSTGRRCASFAAPVLYFHNLPNGQGANSYWGRAIYAQFPVPRPPEPWRPGSLYMYVTMEWMPASLKSQPRPYIIGEFGGYVDPVDKEPLSERGWTLQERALSPRTIHYGTTQMIWECQCLMHAEDGAIIPRDFISHKDLQKPRPTHLGEDDISAPGNHDPWIRLVEDYSSRKLTKSSDRLPAISGIARIIVQYTGDSYYAGLWKSSFLNGLLWHVGSFQTPHQCDGTPHEAVEIPWEKYPVAKTNSYRAPSWSWASIDAPVQHHVLRKDQVLASCVDVEVNPAVIDPFGQVSYGWVRLEVSDD
jgi:hypothetical protein